MTTTAAHDVFSCECHETCSLCTDPWPLSSLKPTADGEWNFVCPVCRGVQT